MIGQRRIKGLARRALQVLPNWLADWIMATQKRLWWKTNGAQQHLKYFDDYKSRAVFIHGLKELLEGGDRNRRECRIIEFGCSGGNNLRLIQEVFKETVAYCGLDINAEAIHFAKQQFPEAAFYTCSDMELQKMVSKLGHFDAFLVSGVLYYLPRGPAQAVLSCAARRSVLPSA